MCAFAALWIVLWATHGLPLRASVCSGCPCWDPPMCPDALGGIKAERQPFVVVGAWSCQCLVCTLPNNFNVISPFSSSRVTALLVYVFRVPCPTTTLDIHGHWNVRNVLTFLVTYHPAVQSLSPAKSMERLQARVWHNAYPAHVHAPLPYVYSTREQTLLC